MQQKSGRDERWGRKKEINPVFDLHQLQIYWEEEQTEGTREIKKEEARRESICKQVETWETEKPTEISRLQP